MIKKATIELKENNEQLVAIKKEISTGLGKRRLMLSEMSGFDLSGNVQNIVCFWSLNNKLTDYLEQNKVVEGSIWITDGNRTAKIDSHEKLENFDIETFFKK